jgi:lysozyme
VAVQKRKYTSKRKPRKGLSTRWKVAITLLVALLLSPFYYGYVIKNISSTWRWIRDIGNNSNYRTYKSFHIRMPEKYKVCGIDVSYYQGKIDWQLVKAMREDSIHITFAFIKATEGLVQADPYFRRNWREAPKAGIICGAYHYFRPEMSGKFQAKFFLQNVKIEKGDLPMVVDVEELDKVSPEKMREQLIEFIKYIKSKTNIEPIIYSGLTFYQDYLAGYFDTNTLWIAHYYQPELKLSKSANWKFWQHSDKARVNGINCIVDFDVFKGDSLAFQKLIVR